MKIKTEILDKFEEAVYCHKIGQLDKAEALYRRILEVDQGEGDVYFNLGTILEKKGRISEAKPFFEKAQSLKPDYCTVYNNLGDLFSRDENMEEATRCYKMALNLKPDYPEAWKNLGRVYLFQGQFKEAEESIKKAISFKSDYADAYHKLGEIYLIQGESGKNGQAMAFFQKAIKLNPGHAAAYNHIGDIFRFNGNFEEAELNYLKALSLDPDCPEVYCNLGQIDLLRGKVKESIEQFQRAKTLAPNHLMAQSNLLSALNMLSDVTPEELFSEHILFEKRFGEPLRSSIRPHLNELSPDRRLKIGYLSSDFRSPLITSFVEPLLAHHNKKEFEIFYYANSPVREEIMKRFSPYVDKWRLILGLSDPLVADLIRMDQIDILVDLTGHTEGHRLLVFARKPAPVQVTWLGYPNTTGLSAMDYRITDRFAHPVDVMEKYHPEKLIRLPESLFCYRSPNEAPNVKTLPAIKNGFLTFGSFNSFAQVSPEMIRLWAEVLKAVPGSHLLLKTEGLNEEGLRKRVYDMFSSFGISGDRLELLGKEGLEKEHLQQYHRVDIGLDTFPFNGVVALCEALWMGVPVITLEGNRDASRMGASVMNKIGLAKLIAKTPKEYVEIAVQLAGNMSYLTHLREGLRSSMKSVPLMNEESFAQNLEKAYRKIWIEYVSENKGKRLKGQQVLEDAQSFFMEGKLEEAEKHYQAILVDDSKNINALHDLGIISFQKGNHQLAVEYLLKALAVKPDYAVAHNNIGVVLNDMGHLNEAKTCYETALALKPDYAEAHNNLGILFRNKGDANEALAHFQKAVDLNSDYTEGKNNLEELKKQLKGDGVIEKTDQVAQKANDMDKWQLKTPVVFIIFNRPDTTEKVFEQIRRARPLKLLVVADGPRPGKPGEAEKCKATREIIHRVDWECEVLTNYSDMNLGCKRRVSTGLDWVFNTVEEAIILEDDCLPDPSFFRFCEDLLEKYRPNERISCISGDNFQFGKNQTGLSYYFSRYCHVWGWATWRRAWKKYDVSMARWPEIRQNKVLQGSLENGPLADFWEGVFNNVYEGKIDTWDFQWVYSSWLHNMLTILPHQNLISNIGFREDATHTKGESLFANMEIAPVQFPLKHPPEITRHAEADSNTEKMMFLPQPVSQNRPVQKDTGHMTCKICSSRSKFFKNATMLNVHSVDYFLCEQCGFIQTEDPYWLKKAYSEAITSSDTGLVRRNIELSKMCKLIISNHFEKSAKFVDYGGGYGLFVRLMRDYGFDFYWLDQHCSNLFAKTFEADRQGRKPYELLTAFEVFEHLVDPLNEIEKMLKLSKTIFFSTELIPANNPEPGEWWYFGLEHGQHISFYTLRTLDVIAKKFNLNLYSNGTTLHILTDKVLKTPLQFSDAMWGLMAEKNIEWFGPHEIGKVAVKEGNNFIEGSYRGLETKVTLAKKLFDSGNLQEAEGSYLNILKENSTNTDALHSLGIIAFQKGQFQSAAEWFLKAITVKPDYAVAYNNLGVVCYKLGRLDEAQACYDSALKFKPDYAEAHHNRGIILRDQGEDREALVAFEKAISLKPDYTEAQNVLEELKSKKHDRIQLSSISFNSSGAASPPMKKMAFVDLAFHQKTKSTIELIEIFKKYFQVDIYWDDGNLDFKKVSDQGYDTAIFFQRIYGLRRLKSLNIKNMIMIPMYDDVLDVTDYYWQQFDQVKFLNFSKTLHEKLSRLGVESKHVPYYISPSTLPNPNPDMNGLSGFLWQRTNYIRWSTIKRLIQGSPFEKIHLHSAVDPPNHIFEKPSDEEIQNYKISISDWFPGKAEYLSVMNRSNVFFAPRLFEGIGMSFLEAMAMGKCVVAPNLPTMNEYIKHGENGLLYDPKNPVPLDFSQADKLGMRARMLAEKGYREWKENEKELIQFISGETVKENSNLKEAVL